MHHCPVTPDTFLLNWQLKSPIKMIQSWLLVVLKSSHNCFIVSCALGLVLPLCGIYVTTTNKLHIGPSSLPHTILDPILPQLISLSAILGDRSIATPAAGSVLFPSFVSATSLHNHLFSLYISLLCALCSSPSPSISAPRDLQYSWRSLMYDHGFQNAISASSFVFDHWFLSCLVLFFIFVPMYM